MPLWELKTNGFCSSFSWKSYFFLPENKQTNKQKILYFDLKKNIHITFAGKFCNISIENLRRCPLHWYAALGRQKTAINLHDVVGKRKFSSSHSLLLEMQRVDDVTHFFGIAMSIFKVVVIQAKLRKFAHTVSIEEDVACGQITMDNLRKSRK